MTSKHVFSQEVDFSISPSVVDLIASPGAELRVPVVLKNFGDQIVLKPDTAKFYAGEDDGKIIFDKSVRTPINFQFQEDEVQMKNAFTLSKGEEKKLTLTIRIPGNTENKDYYYSLLFGSQPFSGKQNAKAVIQSVLGLNILITVSSNGLLQQKSFIDSFSVPFTLIDSFDSVPVSLKVKNDGSNRIKAKGKMMLAGMFGERAIYLIPEQNILAHSSKILTLKPSSVLSGFFIGRYALAAELETFDSSSKMFKETVFFAFPFKIVGVAVLIILSGFLVLRKR